MNRFPSPFLTYCDMPLINEKLLVLTDSVSSEALDSTIFLHLAGIRIMDFNEVLAILQFPFQFDIVHFLLLQVFVVFDFDHDLVLVLARFFYQQTVLEVVTGVVVLREDLILRGGVGFGAAEGT